MGQLPTNPITNRLHPDDTGISWKRFHGVDNAKLLRGRGFAAGIAAGIAAGTKYVEVSATTLGIDPGLLRPFRLTIAYFKTFVFRTMFNLHVIKLSK